MKIIDAFLFYNELDMLYYRLSILYNIVDYFVLVESPLTFAGNPKNLYYNENKERFAKFADKIIHVIDDQLIPNTNDPWWNEAHQRNSISAGINQLQLELDDKIIVADVDEIPDLNALKKIKETEQKFNTMEFDQDMYYYNLTCKHYGRWNFPKIVSYNAFSNIAGNQPQQFRHYNTDGVITPGGWHLSYFGDASYIRNKLEQFSHQEFNSETYKSIDNIEKQINDSSDLFMRDNVKMRKIPISENPYLPPEYETYLSQYM